MWKTKRSKGERNIWVISHHKEIPDLQKNKIDWIKKHFFRNTKTKPDILIKAVLSQKQIGTTSRPELR